MIGRRLIVNYVGQGWTALIGIIFVPVYIAYLGVEAYGIVGLYIVLQGLVALLGGGMVPAVGRAMARFSGGAVSAQSLRDLLRSTESLALGIALCVALALWFASDWLAGSWLRVDTLPRATVADAISVMGLTVACRFVEAIYHASLVGLQRQILLNVATAVIATVRAVGAVAVLAWYSPTIEAYFLWQGLASLASVIILGRMTYAVLPAASRAGRFSMATIREVIPFAGGMLMLAVLNLLYSQGDKLLLSRLLPLPEYGLYTFASLVAGSLLFLIAPVLQSWLPRLVELQSREDINNLRSAFHSCAQVQTVVTATLGLMLVAFAREAIDLWTGNPELDQSAKLVSILALGNVIHALFQVPHMLQIAHGFTRLLMRIQAITLLVAFPLLYVATIYAGTIGAAWAWTASNFGLLVFFAPLMFRDTLAGDKWRWYRDDIALPLSAAGFVILVVRFGIPMPASAWPTFLVLVVTGALAVLSAAAVAPATRRYLLARARSLRQPDPAE